MTIVLFSTLSLCAACLLSVKLNGMTRAVNLHLHIKDFRRGQGVNQLFSAFSVPASPA